MSRIDIFSALGLDSHIQTSLSREHVRSLEIVKHKDFDLGNCADLYSSMTAIPGDNKIILRVKQRHYFSSENNFDRNEFIEDQKNLEMLIAHLKEDESADRVDNKHRKIFSNWEIAELNPQKDIFEKLESQCRDLEGHELIGNDGNYFNIGAVLKTFIESKIIIKPFLSFGSIEESPEIK